MMETLSRTSTNSQDLEKGVTALALDQSFVQTAVDGTNLGKVGSTSSTSSSTKAGGTPLRFSARSTSYSLLSASTVSSTANRKGSHAEAEQSKTSVERPSVSMPPPSSKPSTDRRFSSSRPREEHGSQTGELRHGIFPHYGETASMDENHSPHRNSPSGVLYSIGTTIFNGVANAIPSAASSSADSMRSGLEETPKTSPPLGPAAPLSEGASPATTATDATSITTSSLSQYPGLGVAYPLSLTPNDQFNQPATVQQPQVTASAPSIPRSDPEGAFPNRGPRPQRSSSRNPRRLSASTAASSAGSEIEPKHIGKIGVCALDVKARSKPSRSILTRLQAKGGFEVIVFGDKVILDEAVENWPICDFLISFFSDGFPLDKAIAYAKLRKPFVVNDLPMQKILWDRRLCLRILDQMGVPTPKRIEVNRDGGPKLESAELARHLYQMTGVILEGPEDGTGGGASKTRKVELADDGDTLLVDGRPFRKPFVEKPVSGEDHNVYIYFSRSQSGGGGRRLFRKIGNKSSEYDPTLVIPRSITEDGGSYVYEQFLQVENSEDVKAYTVGKDYCHAETRKSPVVDGLVRRNNQGKELRYITNLTVEEAAMAAKVAIGFGQRICGFDLLRTGDKSYVIDVNGWSFVKDNNAYYDNCAHILREMFIQEKQKREGKEEETPPPSATPTRKTTSHGHRATLKTILKSPSMSKLHAPHIGHRTHPTGSPDLSTSTTPMTSPLSIERKAAISLPHVSLDKAELLPPPVMTGTNGNSIPGPPSPVVEEKPAPMPNSKHSWKLKGMVAVIRHADRTPKQKFKFTFHSQPFVDLLKGHQEEVLLKGEAALDSVMDAVKIALEQNLEDPDKLRMLRTALARKGGWPGTKVQIKPMFRKRKADAPSDEKKPVKDPAASANPSSVSANADPIPEHEPVKDFGLDSPNTEQRAPETLRSQTRSDSISGVTFSRFSAAENDLILDKLQLVIKWGGEPTHAARYQAQDLGVNMRDDMKLMNKEALHDVRIFTSSERRVSTSAAIWAASFLGQKDLSEEYISVQKDLLDDSNAAKDVMDKVKKKLKLLLREGNSAPPQFAWPKDTPEPSIVLSNVVELMKFHRRVLRYNFKKLNGSAAASLAALNGNAEDKETGFKPGTKAIAEAQAVSSIQARWCCGEDAELFKERWEKLFTEFCDTEKVDPSKISELYDSMKFDALHNRQFLEWVFMPSQGLLEEIAGEENVESPRPDKSDTKTDPEPGVNRQDTGGTTGDKSHGLAHRMGFRRRSMLATVSTPPLPMHEDAQDSYFKLYTGPGDSTAKLDKRLIRLRELYKLAKVLFDFVGPQEYGITDEEKLEIGLLTSLPLLREIVADLEELQASPESKSFIYFTKESHIYTLLNCILEGGIQTKISRASIPELDYLSQICFELYEAKDSETDSFNYSIRMSISPGCHSFDPLDVSLDSKHAIGCAPRRSLTAHQNWKEVIESLKAKFDTVKLPKSFLMVNLSDKHAAQRKESIEGAKEEPIEEATEDSAQAEY